MDIDLDLPTNFNPKKVFPTVKVASMLKGPELVKHPCGAYFQGIAVDPMTGLAAIPHKEAQALGFFKIDFLHLSVLDDFSSKTQIRKLMKLRPDWSLLEDQSVVEKLFHIKNHFDLVNRVKPTSVQELADIMALIRPGRRQLLDQYMNDKDGVRKNLLYERQAQDEYSFKRAHAIAYAYNVVLQLHLAKQGLL
jgi:DNA polymerase III alpha subunit